MSAFRIRDARGELIAGVFETLGEALRCAQVKDTATTITVSVERPCMLFNPATGNWVTPDEWPYEDENE
jgi:hypothetical protein